MIEKYYKYKSKYQDYIVLLQIGAFYEVIGIDSLIINHLLGYKLKKISNTFKCGFPLSKVNDVGKELVANHINYIVVKKLNNHFIIAKQLEELFILHNSAL